MRVVLAEGYEMMQAWVENLPRQFAQMGEVIYDARNQIRRIETEWGTMVVKRFHAPKGLNGYVYTSIRPAKAVRAYENARELKSRGVATPEAIAYLLDIKCGRLGESYLVTRESELKHTFYDFRDGVIAGKEELLRSFARFTAVMHEAGVLHLDYSPGNILYDCVDGEWKLEVVDINRMRLGEVSPEAGCRNLCRLWGKSDLFEIVLEEYAVIRKINIEQAREWLQDARKRFWKHRRHDHFVSDDSFTIGVIISTYNHPEWLEKALWGLSNQTHPVDEIIIADDGSDKRTAKLIACYQKKLPIQHVWHEDQGFRKTTILNEAIKVAKSDYLIFMDQDLIARQDYIEMHYRHAEKGYWLSGGTVNLSEELSGQITQEDILSGRLFTTQWLRAKGMPRNKKMLKLVTQPWLQWLLNHITPAKASWNGGNASTWREDILKTRGFDVRMKYGAEDREFGDRLKNMGMRGKQLRYSIPLMHLWHHRPYKNTEDWLRNKAIWKETKRSKRTVTEYGLK